MRGNGESGDVGVKGEVVLRMEVVTWGRFELAHYWENVSREVCRRKRGVVL